MHKNGTDERLKKLTELAEITKRTALIPEKDIINFVSPWKPLLNVALEMGKMKLRFGALLIR